MHSVDPIVSDRIIKKKKGKKDGRKSREKEKK